VHRQTKEPVRGEARRRQRRNRRIWRNCVSVMACVVVFCVTYALIIPAITMEKEAFCGIEAHVHGEDCFNSTALAVVCDPAGEEGLPVLHAHDELCYDGDVLICKLPELAGHVHTDGCYETVTTEAHSHDETCSGLVRGTLLCQTPEDAGHTHDSTCYAAGETLICTETLREGHAHGDACYATERVLLCTLAEGEGHAHNDACYQVEHILSCTVAEGEDHTHGDGCYTEHKTLTCAIPEAPAHAHGDGCYGENKTLTCQIPEDPGHAHTDACYEQVLVCGQEEREGHAHTDACYEMVEGIICGKEEAEAATVTNLVCTLQQVAPHVHNESCSDENGTLICTIQNAVVHQHTEACLQIPQTEENLICEIPVHEHTLSCFSDPQADVETAEDWTKTFAHVELTGNWGEDILAIAKTQLGYNESTKNYIVEEDGETMKGYTRYGAWYGVPYGDWCAMYASFCYRYAAVQGVPLHCNCPAWINELTNLGLFHGEEDYIPNPGELIFFDWNADGSSDHVGIVVETDGDTVKTIEGNSGNTVGYHTYHLTDSTIQGYGALPAQNAEEVDPYLCGLEEHAHTEQCYDAEGNLTCGLEEHTHTEDCLGRHLFYTDGTIRANVTIRGVQDLPKDLSVEVWQITAEENPETYDAMHSALVEKMNREDRYLSSANYYGMQLLSEDAVYELPETADISVNVEFVQPAFDQQTLENATELETFLLTPEETEPAAEDGGLVVETSVVSDEAAFGTGLLSLLSSKEETQEPAAYQADAVEGEDYTGKEDGLTAVTFQTKTIATFAVATSADTLEGTFWTRVNSTADITTGGTYMIVSVEGNNALVGNSNANNRIVKPYQVKGNTNYYYFEDASGDDIVISDDSDENKDICWTFTGSGSTYTIQNQSTSRYLNLSESTFINTASEETLLTAISPEKCWRLQYDSWYNNSYDRYLRNQGGSFTRVDNNTTDGSNSSNDTKGQSKTKYYTRDMLIFKLSDETSLKISPDVGKETSSGGGTVDAPEKPKYADFLPVSPAKTGETAVSKEGVTVSGNYYSDPATSQLEANFRKDSVEKSELIDGKVMSDKSVIYGDDDYGAFETYNANTFGVTLSVLGQEYPIPQTDEVQTPLDVVFVLDVSGSMSANAYQDEVRADAMSAAFNSAVTEIMEDHPENRIGMVMFSTGAWKVLPLGRYTAEADKNGVMQLTTIEPYTKYSRIGSKHYVIGSSSIRPEGEPNNTTFVNAGRNNDIDGTEIIQGVGTYTQAGIAMGAEVFEDVGDDTTYTTTIGEGQYQRPITVKRQPIIILLSDGEPTHATSNFMDALAGPNYGDGQAPSSAQESNTTLRYRNAQGIMGYYTILSANYHKRMVGIQYDKEALFYTIGMGIKKADAKDPDNPNNTNYDDEGYAESATGDRYKRAVLNPTMEVINALDDSLYSPDTTTRQLKNLIQDQVTDEFITVGDGWTDPWLGIPHTDLPVISNPYPNGYSYANDAFFGQMTGDDLSKIFSGILTENVVKEPYGFILYQRSSVSMHDVIGTGMEVKGAPILRYGGNNYTHTSTKTSEDGKTVTYVYSYSFKDPYIPDREIKLEEIEVTVTTADDGAQLVEFYVPDTALPTYTPELKAKQFYYESLPARLIYQVGLTEKSEQEVLDLANNPNGGTKIYYTNAIYPHGTEEDTQITPAAHTYLMPSTVNPFYINQATGEKEGAPYDSHFERKSENTTGTAVHYTDCHWDENAPDDTYRVIHTLGNNGKLVFQADPPKYVTIPVEKQWVSGAEEEITVTLYKVTEGDASAGTEDTWVAEPVEELKLNAQNQWKGTFADKPIPTADWYYAIGEAVPKNYAESYNARVNDEGEITFVNAQMESVLLKDSDPRQYLDLAKIDVTENDDGTLAVTDLVITNTFVPVVLPETGGPGTILYTTGGLLLMMTAAYLLHNQSKKRRKGEHLSF